MTTRLFITLILTFTSSVTARALPKTGDPVTLAERAFESGQFKSCVHLTEQAERLYPYSADVVFLAGKCAERAFDFRLSLRKFQQADALNPNDPDTLNNITILSLKLANDRLAGKTLSRLRSVSPNDQRIEELTKLLGFLREVKTKSSMNDDEIRRQIRQDYMDSKKGYQNGNQSR